MTIVRVATEIAAPPERVFDLALDMEEHARSASATGERIVRTTADGLLGLGDEVTFEARHLGLRRRLTARIAVYERPRLFVDEQIEGPFRAMRHVHRFEPSPSGTTMVDEFAFSAPIGAVTEPLLARHLDRFLERRAAHLRAVAEGGIRVEASMDPQIREHQEVISSDGAHVGTVDHLDGDRIKMTKKDSPDGQHHYLPTSAVDHVDAHVHLNITAAEAQSQATTE